MRAKLGISPGVRRKLESGGGVPHTKTGGESVQVSHRARVVPAHTTTVNAQSPDWGGGGLERSLIVSGGNPAARLPGEGGGGCRSENEKRGGLLSRDDTWGMEG